MGRAYIYYHTEGDEKLGVSATVDEDADGKYIDLCFDGGLEMFLDVEGVREVIQVLKKAQKLLKKKEVKAKGG